MTDPTTPATDVKRYSVEDNYSEVIEDGAVWVRASAYDALAAELTRTQQELRKAEAERDAAPSAPLTPGQVSFLPAFSGDGYGYGGGIVVTFGDISIQLGEPGPNDQRRLDLARLIAASPALVSALEELLAADAVQMPFAEEGIEAQDAWANRRAAAREAARHALRLARGGRT